MHAFVIGVAGYSSAKKGRGFDATLRQVKDVHCAAASARCVADWLIDNRDRLTPPLASLDLLLSEATADPQRAPYAMRFQPVTPVTDATKENVKTRGKKWAARFKDGDSAFLFISGHGAMKGNDAVVFLSDLNEDDVDPWGAYLNLTETARALKVDTRLKTAFIFSDACQEYSRRFAEVTPGDGARFIRPADPILLALARDKVAFVTAASQGLETLEGDWDTDPAVKMGRFTQVLLEALSGASARQSDGVWVVHADGIAADLKNLYRLRQWTDLFEPSRVLSQNERYTLIQHQSPEVPFVVKTDPPERISECSLAIFLPPDRSKVAVKSCDRGPAGLWPVRIPASDLNHLLVAGCDGSERVLIFTPSEPIFGRTIAFK